MREFQSLRGTNMTSTTNIFLKVQELLNEELRKQDYYEEWMRIDVEVTEGSESNPLPKISFTTSKTSIDSPTDDILRQQQRVAAIIDGLKPELNKLFQ